MGSNPVAVKVSRTGLFRDRSGKEVSVAYRHISVELVSPTIGAEVGNVDLSRPLSPPIVNDIRQALLERGVLFFRGQDITPEQQLSLARNFGELEISAGAGTLLRTTGQSGVVAAGCRSRPSAGRRPLAQRSELGAQSRWVRSFARSKSLKRAATRSLPICVRHTTV